MASMFNVTWDVAPLTLDYIDDNWGEFDESDNPSKPEKIRLVSEDEDGNPKKGWDPASYDYVLISENESRNVTPVDGPRETYNLSASVNVRITTPKSRARRTAMWEELLLLALKARKRRLETPGNWDTMTLEPQTVPDDNFNFWLFEGAWLYEAKGRTGKLTI